MSYSMRLTLIVCTYRRAAEVGRLLQAIGQQTRMPDETLIVDGSPDGETEKVVADFRVENGIPDLHYHRVPPEERGLTRQRNYGIARADGEVIAFLDDDTVPEADYFAETLACFERHPETVGVGGFITNEVEWRKVDERKSSSSAIFKWGKWERREAYRWRLRKLFGLTDDLAPGLMPEAGHGRPTGYLPPDGGDHRVEFLIGCSFAWRREVFRKHQFSRYFEGYSLYEDLDFCVRASRDAPLYFCTRARLAHHHAPGGRPGQFHYGEMVVRNGWLVWRRRWAEPSRAARVRWWATTMLLTVCQFGDAVRGPARAASFAEACGRIYGMATLLWKLPEDAAQSQDHLEIVRAR